MHRSSYKEDIYEKAYNIYYPEVNGTPYRTHVNRVRECYRFFDGKQWYAEEIAKLARRKQGYVTVNIIAAKIRNIVGLEQQTETTFSVGSNYNNKEHNFLASSLNHIILNIQEVNSFNRMYSYVLKDMAICGVGFPRVYKYDGIYHLTRDSPFSVVPDMGDSSDDFTKMRHISIKHWLDPQVVKKTFGKKASNLEIPDQNSSGNTLSPEFMDRQTNYTDFNQPLNGRMLVVEVQYKVPTIAYTGFDRNDRYFKTFDYDIAEQITASKNEIKEEVFDRVKRTLITSNNTVLEHSNLDPDLPISLNYTNYTGFSCIPCVWEKEQDTGLPVGMLWPNMDICRMLNTKLQKAIYLSNTKKLILKGVGNNALKTRSVEQLREELQRDDGILQIEGEYEYRENIELGDKEKGWIKDFYYMLDTTTGMYGEQSGQETNATSGVAIANRQISSIRNNVHAFGTLVENKKMLLTFLLHMILGSYDRNILSQAADEKQKETILLNITHQTKKGEVIFNNIDNFPGYIYLKEGPNYKSTFEEDQAKLEAFLQNPNAMLYVHSPRLMEQIGFSDAEEISQDLLKAVKLKAMAEQGIFDEGQAQQSLPEPKQGEMLPISPNQLVQGEVY